MKFDYFYGGHVAMEDLGFAGRPVAERIEADEHLALVFAEARAMAQLSNAGSLSLAPITIGAGALGIPPEAIRQTIEWFGRDVLSQFEEASTCAQPKAS